MKTIFTFAFAADAYASEVVQSSSSDFNDENDFALLLLASAPFIVLPLSPAPNINNIASAATTANAEVAALPLLLDSHVKAESAFVEISKLMPDVISLDALESQANYSANASTSPAFAPTPGLCASNGNFEAASHKLTSDFAVEVESRDAEQATPNAPNDRELAASFSQFASAHQPRENTHTFFTTIIKSVFAGDTSHASDDVQQASDSSPALPDNFADDMKGDITSDAANDITSDVTRNITSDVTSNVTSFSNQTGGFSSTAPEAIFNQAVAPLVALAESLARRETRVVRLHLRPEDFGRLEISLTRHADGSLNAQLGTENRLAHQTLVAGIAELRTHLEQLGIVFEDLSVTINTNSDASNRDAQTQHQTETAPRLMLSTSIEAATNTAIITNHITNHDDTKVISLRA